jgi:hypothetical protein
MDFTKYIENTLPDTRRTPIDTVTEFVEVYNKWAKDCHHLVKANRAHLNELTRIDSVARRILLEIYKKYCTPKNVNTTEQAKGIFSTVVLTTQAVK